MQTLAPLDPRDAADAARLLALIIQHDPETGCWLLKPDPKSKGYAKFKFRGRTRRAHRVSYELFVGPIPPGLVLDHRRCNGRRNCIRPDHLDPVTNRENLHRSPLTLASINAAKTHCPRNHEYTPENTRVIKGKRQCIACKHNDSAVQVAA